MIRRHYLAGLHWDPVKAQVVTVIVVGAMGAAIVIAALLVVRDSVNSTNRFARAEDLSSDIAMSAAAIAQTAAETERVYYKAAVTEAATAGTFRVPTLTALDIMERLAALQSNANELHGSIASAETLALLQAATDLREAYRNLLAASDLRKAPAPEQDIAALQTVLVPRAQAIQQQSSEVHSSFHSQVHSQSSSTTRVLVFACIGLVAAVAVAAVILGLLGWAVGKKLTRAVRDVTAEKSALAITARVMERRNTQLQALYQIVTEVTETLSMKYVVQTTIREAHRLVGADLVVLRLLRGDALEVAGALQDDDTDVSGLHTIQLGEGIEGRAAKRGRLLRTERNAKDSFGEGEGFTGAQSGVVVPLIVGARVVGTLACWSRELDLFTTDDEKVLEMMASQVATAVVAADTYETTEHHSRHDPLTALPNRRQLTTDLRDRFGPELARGTPVAVAMVDVDHFKRFNDEFGHQVGDVTLQRVAEVIRSTLRETDDAYRYGGEEFVLLVENDDREAVAHLMERVREAVATTLVKGDSLQAVGPVTISIGVAFGPEDSRDPEALIKMADAALYDAKRAGRNRVCLYAADAGAAATGESAPAAA